MATSKEYYQKKVMEKKFFNTILKLEMIKLSWLL